MVDRDAHKPFAWPNPTGIRDWALLAVAAVYALGHLVWGFRAYSEGVGNIPLDQGQYFAAGVLPFLALAFGFTVAAVGARGMESIFSLVITLKPRLAFIVRGAAFAILLVLGAIAIVALTSTPLSVIVFTLVPVWAILVVLPMSLAIGLQRSGLLSEGVQDSPVSNTIHWHQLTRPDRYVLSLAIVPIWVYVFVAEVYPNIPQEFGGTRPRHATLDLDRGKLSQDTREALLPRLIGPEASPISRSEPVTVYFAGQTTTLIRPNTDSARKAKRLPLIEIANSAIIASHYTD